MKIDARSADAFLRKPDPAIRAVLVYGPDEGLIRERADRLVAGVVSTPDDPFLVTELTGDAIAGDPARLFDEAAAISMIGGRRVVRVRDAGDAAAGVFGDFLAAPAGDALVVVQAGNLASRSALRRAFEDSKTGAAMACYADNTQSLDRLVDEILVANGIVVTADARAYLSGNLGSDRGVSRSELEKLRVYAGDGGRVDAADAMACIGDNALRGLDDVALAAADGDRIGLDKALVMAQQEGTHEVAILRAMARHLLRLHWIAARLEAGEQGRKAVQGLQPPVFVFHVDRMVAQAGRWRREALSRALAQVLEAERLCKTTGMPEEAICGRALLQVSALARKRTP